MKSNNKGRRLIVLSALLCAISVWQFAAAAYIHAKAELAQWLIADTWQKIKQGDKQARPWPWADTRPVARLRVPALHVDQMILAGASGRTLAFGPGWMLAGSDADETGIKVVAGHRDTHFAFLRDLKVGDRIDIESVSTTYHYRVRDMQIVDSEQQQLLLSSEVNRLLLVTCYPFDALNPGGSLRYLVAATPVDD